VATIRVAHHYSAQYADPITVRAGDRVHVGPGDPEFPGWLWCTGPDQRGGWVPEQLLQRTATEAIMLEDYTARELSVRAGAEVVRHRTMNGWVWVSDAGGNDGWVPERCLASDRPAE